MHAREDYSSHLLFLQLDFHTPLSRATKQNKNKKKRKNKKKQKNKKKHKFYLATSLYKVATGDRVGIRE